MGSNLDLILHASELHPSLCESLLAIGSLDKYVSVHLSRFLSPQKLAAVFHSPCAVAPGLMRPSCFWGALLVDEYIADHFVYVDQCSSDQ